MPFDANLVLADTTADWTYANLVTSDYGTPVLTSRNAGGFAIIDLASNRITNLIESTRPNQIPLAGRFSPDGRWIAFHATMERPADARRLRSGSPFL